MNHLTCKIHWTHSTLEESFDPEMWNQWEKKQKAILSDSVHPVRLQNSVLARMSFEKLKALHGEVFNPSYTHTDGIGLCSVTEKENEFSGIDIERADREIREDSYKMFINDEDADLPPLHLWCIKEAAFKALSNASLEIKLIKNVIVKDDSFLFEDKQGSWSLEKLDGNYLIALTTLNLDQAGSSSIV